MNFGGFTLKDVEALIPQTPEPEKDFGSGIESIINSNLLELELVDNDVATESIVYDIESSIYRDKMTYGLEEDATQATGTKDPWYKRAWAAIKKLFEKLGNYIRTFWTWITEKFKKLKGGISARLSKFTIKTAWYRNVMDRLKKLFSGKKGEEVTDDQVDKVVEEVESEMRAQTEAVRDGDFSGVESVVGTESLWSTVKGFFGDIKEWVKKKVKSILNKNKTLSVEEIEKIVTGNSKLPKFKVNEASFSKYQSIVSDFKGKLEDISESNPKVGNVIINYGIVCGLCASLLDNGVKVNNLPSSLKDSYSLDEVNSILNVLIQIVGYNGSFLGFAEPEDYDGMSISSIIKACGTDSAIKVIAEYESMGETYTNIFFKKYDMIVRSLNEGSNVYMTGFLENEPDETRFKTLVSVLKVVRNVSIRLTRVAKEMYKGIISATNTTDTNE